jgi:hypothetical protein
MQRPTDNDAAPTFNEPPSWSVAAAIAVTIVICIAAFVWIFVRLEPLMSDFVSDDALATPTVTATSTPELP